MDCESVVTAYRQLRDSLASLADRATDQMSQITLRQRALVAGDLAEQCEDKFAGQDVPAGEAAAGQADDASGQAKAASGDDAGENNAVAAAAAEANATLNAILQE